MKTEMIADFKYRTLFERLWRIYGELPDDLVPLYKACLARSEHEVNWAVDHVLRQTGYRGSSRTTDGKDAPLPACGHRWPGIAELAVILDLGSRWP